MEVSTIPLLLLACSVVFTLVSYISFAESLKRMEASRMGALVALTPLITIGMMGLLALHDPTLVPMDPLNELASAGAILVVVGSMCCSLGRA